MVLVVKMRLYLRCTQVLVDITSKGCTELRVHVIIIDIDNFLPFFQLNKNVSTTQVACE